MSVDTSTTHPATSLRERLGDLVHLPGDASYDVVRVPWNVAVDQRPAAVATPTTAEEVSAVVRAAAELGLRVAPQSSGHGAAPLAHGNDLSDVVLLRTSGLRGVTVDPEARTARVAGGALWQDVVEAAAPHGLAALHGSSPDVAVAGYSLGGGIGWYARQHGLAANSIVAAEVVTADGRIVRVDASHRRKLFWALRGGGGSFGVVTALELRLFPIADAYAGMFLWDLADPNATTAVRRWAAWSATAPDEVTTSLRVMRFPPMPELPDFLRGRQLVVIDGAVLGSDERGAELVGFLRDLAPEMDTWTRMPAAAITRLHMDPEGPTPSVGGSVLLDRFDEDAVEAFLAAVGPGAETTLLFAELRQLGGALGRPHHGGGVLRQLAGSHAAFFLAVAATPEMATEGAVSAQRAIHALSPWANGRNFLNFSETPTDTATAYEEKAFRRLRKVRAKVDPAGLFLANHPVPRS